MEKYWRIVKKNIPIPIMDEDGNIHYDTSQYRFRLQNEKGEIISNQYQCMICLENDHFAVCDITEYIEFNSRHDYREIIKKEYKISDPKLKWGIIRINRDEKGNVIPQGETIIVPYLYDKVISNNANIATVYNNGKATYVDIDQASEYYGKQLVPCVLERVGIFNFPYEGFAECSIGKQKGFLPRNCKPKDHIEEEDLLTYMETMVLFREVETSSEELQQSAKSHYYNLTGVNFKQEKNPVLSKK